MASITIRYAKKPWDRGEPLTRTVEVPNGYTVEQAERWLWERLRIKIGETVVSYTPNCRSPAEAGEENDEAGPR
jgi:hypothetical protein